ncbi:ribosome biogenesis protein YTM1 [Exidia glandulosa HHB12029]|uniref:Ribosome biogenesis protein YTM1 n=1 Tax=Exidia glandulosa HHB12029 TaxID=1314781 RepID=A0A165KVM6_EXIGL|nr:ribosome biogenesis protein YTM1 [Exidia glandulosa HHB12029]
MSSQPVVFTTRTSYTIPSQTYMLPNTWKRFQLSQLINKVLALLQPVPFDFLVRGELLRGSIADWCTERGVGEEETVEIEYIEATIPPQRAATLPHDDWVASISCAQADRFVTAAYDGNVRIFSSSQELLHTIPAHSAPVLSAAYISSSVIASSSHDRTARLTRLDENGTADTFASLVLHTAPVASISANTDGSRLLTASWDGLLGVWDTNEPDADEVPADTLEEKDRAKKRRRVEDAKPQPKRKAPLEVLKGHTGRVSQSAFAPGSSTEAYSCSFDSTVRAWDVRTGVCTRTIALSEKPFTALALPSNGTVIASSTDRTLSLLDVRSPNAVPASGFGHPSLPTSLAAHPSDGVRVVSGAADGVVRIWDVRSTKAAVSSFDLWRKDEKKVLGVSWGAGIIGVAGEGGVEIWRLRDSGVAA